MAKQTKKKTEETPESEVSEVAENPWEQAEGQTPAEETEMQKALEAEDEPAAAGEEPVAEEEESVEDPIFRVAELENEAADLKDKLLRALAETENVRRRALRDRQEAAKYGIANFAREMLGVADNLRRALDHVDGDVRKDNEAIESLAAGVEMTERAMLDALERFGVKPIEAMGQKFDHNFHEAMFEAPDPTKPNGTVIQELEKGYTLAERLLRPARVGVSKGGPAANGEPKPADAPAPKPEAVDSPEEKVAAKDQRAAYEKRTDAQAESGEAKGGQIDENL